MIFCIIIAIIGLVFYIINRKLKIIYAFWNKQGVKGPKPLWLVGNALSVIRKKESLNSLSQKLYDMYPNEKVVGIYLGVTPTLILKDLTLVRKVLIKDFASFADRGLKVTEERLSNNIFVEEGEKWKVYRQKLSPLFSTGRMKKILEDVTEHVDEYLNYIENLPAGPKELRILDHKLGVKLLMKSSFGFEIDTYNEDIRDIEREGYDLLTLKIRDIICTMLQGFNPDLPSTFGLKLASANLEKFVKMIINKSKEALKENPYEYKTFFGFMNELMEQGVVIKEKRDGFVKVEISDSVLAGHVLLFFATSFEGLVNSSFLLFELAQNQQIQERCYKEILQVLENYNGDLNLEATEHMQYLNMAFDESLRKYPTGGSVTRRATRDYQFEDIDLKIEKHMKVIVPVMAIHYDPRYFPNPEVFDPERFSPENKKNIPDCSYLPFGDGPRKCIGLRQARFLNILLVARFLQKFKVTPCEKTVSKIRFEPYRFSLVAQDGLWVNITKRE